ncbi:MAG TPA: hypothetical protein VHV79_03110 [Mycobacteriales bacterium]|nr:hypothetical protein [Mycobacteriales bacterium]
MTLANSGIRAASAAVIGVLAIAVGGAGIATAANGGSLVLGSHNSETHTTTLTDHSGTPLALIAKKGKAPFTVNSNGLVKKLNAGELGGLTAGTLSSGTTSELKYSLLGLLGGGGLGIGLPEPSGSTSIPTLHYKSIFNTKKLAAGIYQVNASVFGEGICAAGTKPPASIASVENFLLLIDPAPSSLNTVLKAKKGQEIHVYCAGISSDTPSTGLGGIVIGGGMNVQRVQSSITGQHAAANSVFGGLLRKKLTTK